MDQHARIVVMVVRIAAHMIALVDNQYLLARVSREAFRDYTACEPGSDDKVVKHPFHSWGTMGLV
jgi:hypothetical protein